MKITLAQQTIDLVLPDKFVISLSGGADSASLLLLICEKFPDIGSIEIVTCKDTKKPWDGLGALDIVQWMQERFPNIKLNHHVLDIDEADPYWCGIAQDLIDKNDPTCAGLTNPRGVGKMLQLAVKREEILKILPDHAFIYAMTSNPPEDDMKELGMYDLAERRRDKSAEKPHAESQPFVNVDKKFVAAIYEHYGVTDELFPMTASCVGSFEDTIGFTQPCEKCFWCRERHWAFGKY